MACGEVYAFLYNEQYRKLTPIYLHRIFVAFSSKSEVRLRHPIAKISPEVCFVKVDLAWNFRSNFEQARLLKVKQDDYCEKALAANSKGAALPDTFPDDLQLEALVDVLRGKVRLLFGLSLAAVGLQCATG